MSKAKAASVADAASPQQTVLVVQVEALQADEVIRSELAKRGFAVLQQTLAMLTAETARHYAKEIRRPDSALYAAAVTAAEAPDSSSTAASADDAKPTASAPSSATSTPRGTSKDTTTKQQSTEEEPEDVAAGLLAGPLLVLLLAKPNAVAELQELVGPATPAMWGTQPATWRARLGQDAIHAAVRCSLHERTASAEMAFFLAHPHPQAASTASLDARMQHRHVATASSAEVSLDHLLRFLFPPRLQHADSTGRLLVFALYGPLDAHGHLRSGQQRSHVVTDLELDTMAARMAREDLLSIFALGALSQQEEAEVLRHVDAVCKTLPMLTPRDIETLFASLPRSADGLLQFADMQTAILQERCRRVVCLKDRVLPVLAPPLQNQFRRALTRERTAMPTNQIAPPSMFLRDVGLTGAENASLIARLLSRHAFEICHLDDGNAPSLTQNVRLLRADAPRDGDARPAWRVRG